MISVKARKKFHKFWPEIDGFGFLVSESATGGALFSRSEFFAKMVKCWVD